jgi:hypothetical protein
MEGLAQVPAGDWDRLLSAGSSALSHGFLRAWERCELSGLRSRPVLAFEAGSSRPLGACPGYFYDLDVVGVRVPSLVKALGVVRRFRPAFMTVRTYELGSPTPLTNPFLVTSGVAREVVVPQLVERALQEAEAAGAQFVLVQNMASLHGPAAQTLMPLGFAGIPILPTAVVDLPYKSFDEYLSAMRAQYRRRANQTLKRSAELRVEHVRSFGPLAEQLASLWLLIYKRAKEIRREILTPGFFRAAAELDDASVLLLRRPDGTVASFALLLDDRPWLSFLQCGFDADAGRSEGAYFRLLYEIIRLGIEGGFEQVDLGVTTLAPKLDVGGVPVPLYGLVKHRNSLVQSVVRRLANGPLGPEQVEARHVFKEAPPTASDLVARRGLLV